MFFPEALAQNKMPKASSRIWTRITDSVFYFDKRYIKCTANLRLFVELSNIFHSLWRLE